MKIRIDKLLVDRKLVPSRERAQALILAGKVLADEQKIVKPGTAIDPEAAVRILGEDLRYVSRGGLKLEAALKHWSIRVAGRTCLDIGASTGGFTDCLLQHGAARVIAIDTGYGQIDYRLRTDPRVRLLEKTNARYLKPEDLGERVDLVVIDVSFISVTLVLPGVIGVVRAFCDSPEIVALVKPQFEVGRDLVGKGGIVRDPEAQQGAITKVSNALVDLGFEVDEALDSPILGAEGNREFLLHAKTNV